MSDRVFLTGASGYIGGRLAPRLLEEGYAVRCLARSPRKLDARPWRVDPRVEVVRGDMSDEGELSEQMRGCRFAYYLVHSMEASVGAYAERDAELARAFALAAETAGVERIIYLGGLGEMGDDLSEHLRSRREVERELASGAVPVTTLRAAMIIGSGSASFEILRYLVERLPAMVTPRWVRTESQPVAVRDVLHWLVACLRTPGTAGRAIEIGGPDVMEYRDLMRVMAEELGLPRRLIVPVPVLTPRLSSLWIGLVTPVGSAIARPLAEGLRNRVVVTDPSGMALMPHEPVGVRESIRRALGTTREGAVETRWSAAGPIPGDPDWAGGTAFTDERTIDVEAPCAGVYRAFCRVGGGHGWYAADALWRIRGWMDKLVGGPGLRRGRRDPENVEFGEALDFWRVVGVEPDRRLTLRAEMKLPGVAVLDLVTEPIGEGRSRLTMTARFRPKGLFGILYWYAVLPAHALVFGGMLRGMKRAAEADTEGRDSDRAG
ncbi:MAG: oxidoreductase [Phycisphaeraceae bacterium]|nr:MAG: oxidoreductase [Phycisphaeraceae bacterium]